MSRLRFRQTQSLPINEFAGYLKNVFDLEVKVVRYGILFRAEVPMT